jgi:hypothetical protein
VGGKHIVTRKIFVPSWYRPTPGAPHGDTTSEKRENGTVLIVLPCIKRPGQGSFTEKCANV